MAFSSCAFRSRGAARPAIWALIFCGLRGLPLLAIARCETGYPTIGLDPIGRLESPAENASEFLRAFRLPDLVDHRGNEPG